MMKEFEKLLLLADRLIGPKGCPWDQEQTIDSLAPYLIEEAKEVLQAVENKDVNNLIEELGDLLYLIIFLSKVGEKEGKISLIDVMEGVNEKMVRRKPHIFGDAKVTT